jgi:hypothetical protein
LNHTSNTDGKTVAVGVEDEEKVKYFETETWQQKGTDSGIYGQKIKVPAKTWNDLRVVARSAIGSGTANGAVPPLSYQPKPLPFSLTKLQGISEELITSHHDKNYAGAIKRLGAIQEKIGQLSADAAPYQMGALKRDELIAMNSMILHDGKAGGDIVTDQE